MLNSRFYQLQIIIEIIIYIILSKRHRTVQFELVTRLSTKEDQASIFEKQPNSYHEIYLDELQGYYNYMLKTGQIEFF